ncbi:bifunctional riboflavin kinase/FAD synthetase [Saccharibacillus sp. CPCC 101409]|uniref:bifunctional riboflavin kinase/FAD synthetase n=1 Tax=Saccharibacillus sp. CPCC 101409 TaxID=3058041 RepID=UPI0026721BCA|nr:bifunctional riboflavin kinase/FAD synthetase [Saccharibacillus sp. CPCC 101409]MDO3410652.1 bifunctional riboflavin kinase/FAD synthetase [Saccharibacillus sp. CPCC 101409]
MKTVTLTYPLTSMKDKVQVRPQVMAIGQFDGLHLGHASVIRRAIELGRSSGLPVAVLTFHPHPKDVMGKGDYEGYLTPLRDKEKILAEMGVDYLYVGEFTPEFSKVSPADFVGNVLVPLEVDTAVVGFDFRFGYLGEGTAEAIGPLSGGAIKVETIAPFLLEGEKVGSSGIRAALKTGDAEKAGRWLGRPYRVKGTVVGGDKRGRTIGFPTANVDLSGHYVTPAKGVYAVRFGLGENVLGGVMNVGVKPTFTDGSVKPTFETHLFDFDRSIYGEEVWMDFVRYIRPERKFSGIDELVEQIAKDADEARNILKG